MSFDGTVVRSLRGKKIIFTGALTLRGGGVGRVEAIRIAAQMGADVSTDTRAKVSRNTDLLVRGESDRWSDGDYGADEKAVARYQAQGHGIRIIDAAGFASLLEGGWAYAISPSTDAERLPNLTAPYRPARDDATPEPVPTTIDLVAATNAHNRFQNALAERALACGLTPVRSLRPDAQFDLAWHDGDNLVIVEVKSLNIGNAAQQLRLGLGQVLDYQARLGDVTPVLAVDSDPPDSSYWDFLCATHGVTLVWPDVLDRILIAL